MKYSSDIIQSTSDSLICINNCGELRATLDNVHTHRHTGRNDYQLIYIREGRCDVTIDNMLYVAYQGDYILYRPGEPQDYLLSKRDHTHTYWIHFSGSMCQKLFETFSLEDVHIIQTGQNREIAHMVSRICQYHNLKIPNREFICSNLLQCVLALLSNEAHKENDPLAQKSTDKISELIGHIKMVPNLKISVSKCANFCYMSEAHLTRVFKRTTGMSPTQFILSIRIDRAKELLDFTDLSIAEVSEACGFADQNYFARIFKKSVGMTPTQYRGKKKSK